MVTIDEAHIIRRILDGETALYEHFLRHYGQEVFSLIVRIVGNREDAEELTQDVFLKAFEKLSTFQGRSSFSTWIYAIAYRTALSEARKRTYDEHVMDEHELASLSDTLVDEALNDTTETRLALLRRAIRRLEAEEQAIITLFYHEEKSLKEMTQITGLNEGNLKVKLHRIRKKLYVFMKEEEDSL